MKTLLMLAAVASLFTGCAATGPTYQDAKNSGALTPPQGKGMVVIYVRGPKYESNNLYKVYANDQLITESLKCGKFMSYEAIPGPLRLSSTAHPFSLTDQKRDRIALDVASGETYYVELLHTAWHETMELRSWNEAEKDINKCELMKPQGR